MRHRCAPADAPAQAATQPKPARQRAANVPANAATGAYAAEAVGNKVGDVDPVTYPRAVWDEDQKRLISDAEVSEIPYTAFAAKKGQAITAPP